MAVAMKEHDIIEKLSEQLDVIKKCTISTNRGIVLLATFLESRYPYVYPRDCLSASTLFKAMTEKGLERNEEAFDLLKGIARFIASVQEDDGHWMQRYGLNGQNKAIYIQEDNTAYGAIILANYLLACTHRNEQPDELDEFLSRIKRAIQYALKHFYRQEIYLFFSTTSLHESAIEKGYSIWVNHLYILLFNLISQLKTRFDLETYFKEELSFKNRFCQSVHRHFILNDRFIRRISPSGTADLRPDVTLMSPVYFKCKTHRCPSCLLDDHQNIIQNSIKYMEESLWDPELGMLQRYLPFTEDIETHIHSGNGPWTNYTAILAQYYYQIGKLNNGDKILDWIDRYRSEEGYIPEHLSTKKRFEEFIRLEWETGLDSRKEFHSDILIPKLSFDLIVEELFFMKKSYDGIRKEIAENKKEVIQFALPLMWSHVEYARALVDRCEALEVDKEAITL